MNLARIHAQSADELHEQRIDECYARWLDRKAKWSELVELINQRSAEQVDRMERERGLTHGGK